MNKTANRSVLVVTPLALILFFGLTPIAISQTNDTDAERPFYIPREPGLPGDGYKLYDKNDELQLVLNHYEVDAFEHQFFDRDTNNYKPEVLELASSAGIDITKPIINWDSKVSVGVQRDIYFIKAYLGQTMSPDEIDKLQYKFALYFEGKAVSYPDYVTVLSNPKALEEMIDQLPPDMQQNFLPFLEDEAATVLASINKMYELENIENIKHVSPFIQRLIEYEYDPTNGISPELIYQQPFKYQSPKKQLENGLLAFQIQCNQGLELVLKLSDNNTPICVSSNTAEKLKQRDWSIKAL